MPIVKIFSGTFCQAQEVVSELAARLGCETIGDEAVVKEAARRFGLAEAKLARTLAGKVSAFESFTHERGRNIAAVKQVLAEFVKREDLIITGGAGLLIPRDLPHVLSVCIIAELHHRHERAVAQGLSRKDAQKQVARDDEGPKLWAEHLFKKSPWDAELYDILVPMSKTTVAEAVELIVRYAAGRAVKVTPASRSAVEDFGLAARVEAALGEEGHDVAVSARTGKVTLTINKHSLMLARLEDELATAAKKVEGVREVETKVGPGFYQADAYRRFDFEAPSRVLLVDDEKEFVQTLSERLQMRDVGAVVAYDGEQALSFVAEEQPDVIVLDLRMPGLDGIEVLRRLKKEHSAIEVIILTGHGTEKDEQLCLELGAFAYLHKPVDIDRLSQVMREASRKARDRK